MSRTLVLSICITAALIIAGCTAPSDHVESSETTLSVEYPEVRLGPSGYFWVYIKGGNAPYKVLRIGDSSMVTAYVPPGNTGTRTHIELSALGKLGTTTVTVRDSAGLTGTVTIHVEAFAVFPLELLMRPGTDRIIRTQGGKPPFTVTSVSDSCITVLPSFSFAEIYARYPGTSVVTISDASLPANIRQVVVTVEPRNAPLSGTVSFSSNVGDVRWEGPYIPSEQRTDVLTGAGSQGLRAWNDMYEAAYVQGMDRRADGKVQYLYLSVYNPVNRLMPGSTPIDPQDIIHDFPYQSASFSFVKDASSPSLYESERYALTSGSVDVQEIGNGRIRGTFSGSGFYSVRFMQYDSTRPITVTNGSFDVPYEPDIVYSAMMPERGILAGGTDPLLDRYRDALAVRRQCEHAGIGR